MTSVVEARHRLDKTLSSSALSDTAILNNLVRKQLLKTSREKLLTDEVVERKSKQLLKLVDDLKSAKGERSTKVVDGEWKVKQDTPRFRVMYREGPEGAPYHSLCLDGIIDGPLSHALCVGCEVPMYKEWWPQFHAPTFKIVESKWLQRDTVGGDYSVLRFKVPWPVAMREVILSAFELEYFDEDLVAVLYNSAPDVPDEKVDGISSNQIPASSAVRMELAGGFVLQKIGHNCSFFRIVVDLDMKLDLVPPWLINFIARQLVGHGYKLYQKAVTGVKGSKLEKLANSDPLYKRLQALDDASLSKYEPAAVPMSPAKKNTVGFSKGPSKEEEIVSLEVTFKPVAVEDASRISEDSLSEEKQDIVAPLNETNLGSHIAPIPKGLYYGNLDSNTNAPEHAAETNNIEVATASAGPQEQQRSHSKDDGPTDPEVRWALEMLEKLIAHFNSQKTTAQTVETKDTVVEDQEIVPLPRTHRRGLHFFKIGRRHKDKEKKSTKRHDQSLEMNLKPGS